MIATVPVMIREDRTWEIATPFPIMFAISVPGSLPANATTRSVRILIFVSPLKKQIASSGNIGSKKIKKIPKTFEPFETNKNFDRAFSGTIDSTNGLPNLRDRTKAANDPSVNPAIE